MPSWRCPHCSTPQPVASRCWVCHRSSTSRGTCRHFRGSVAARIGFCGLDRQREPLRGDEVRACWEDGAVAVAPDPVTPGLLDLLTVAALGEPASGDLEDTPSAPDRDALDGRRSRADSPGDAAPIAPIASRATVESASGSRRLWVEVEV
jgi:hypothetical protein